MIYTVVRYNGIRSSRNSCMFKVCNRSVINKHFDRKPMPYSDPPQCISGLTHCQQVCFIDHLQLVYKCYDPPLCSLGLHIEILYFVAVGALFLRSCGFVLFLRSWLFLKVIYFAVFVLKITCLKPLPLHNICNLCSKKY